jgi:peptide/nickel transport system substrate-binding protein
MKYPLLTIFLTLFLTACSPSQEEETSSGGSIHIADIPNLQSRAESFEPGIGTYGGTLRLALGANPDGFCPALTNSGYSMEVMGYIYEGMIKTNPVTLEREPHLAEKWTVSEDERVWTFHLRDDVFFSDSVQMTAKDVVFTFNDVIYNDALNSPLNITYRVDGEKFDVRAVDSFTIEFRLPKPFAPFLTIAGTPILPAHRYDEPAREGNLRSFLSAGSEPSRVVGTGPFTLKSVDLGQRVILERNPYYWQKNAEGDRLPYIDTIIMRIIEEPNLQMMRFQRGEIDHISITGKQYPVLSEEMAESNYFLYRVGPRWYNRFLKFNQNDQKDDDGTYFVPKHKQEIFRNADFRRAVAYSINYQDIIDIVYNGLAKKPMGVIGKRHPRFYNPQAPLYDYDPAKADSLFREAGLEDKNGDGRLQDSRGENFSFTFSATAGVELIENIAGIIRKDMQERGIEMDMDLTEFNSLIEKTEQTYDWDAVCYSLSVTEDPHFGRSSYLANSRRYIINPLRLDEDGDTIPKTYRPFEKRIIEIFEQAALEMDEGARKDLYDEWQYIEQDKVLSVYLPVMEVILGIQDRFGNIHITPHLARGESLLHNIHEIYITE